MPDTATRKNDRTIELWFDFASTYSYPAVMRFEDEARIRGVRCAWRPFLLGPIFAAQSWNDSPFNLYPVKGRYMWHDMERLCRESELAYTKPSAFPRNGLLAARVAIQLPNEHVRGAFIREVFVANFVNDNDISDLNVLTHCLQAAAVDPLTALGDAKLEVAKLALREQTESAQALGLFGAPSYVVDGEIFWGNERFDSALRSCTAPNGA